MKSTLHLALALTFLTVPSLFAIDLSKPQLQQEADGGRPQPAGDIVRDEHKYTPADPSAQGGIRGRLVTTKPIFEVLAISINDPRKVYRASFGDSEKRQFELTGLPMEKYDLVVISDDVIYEGLTLSLDDDTLTTKDRKEIEAIIQRGGAFFAQKIIFRSAGTPGKGNKARAIAAFIRNKGSHDQAGLLFTDHRRSIKIIELMHVGPGWQVSLERELYVSFIKPGTGPNIKAVFRDYLNGVRVTDKIKDLGEINLQKTGGPG